MKIENLDYYCIYCNSLLFLEQHDILNKKYRKRMFFAEDFCEVEISKTFFICPYCKHENIIEKETKCIGW